MEDQERRLEGPEKESGIRPRGESENPRKWIVMIMGPIGKVRSFKISPRLIFWCFIFFVLYFSASILIIHRWTALEKVTRKQQIRISRELEPRLKEAEQDLFKTGQRVALLKRHIESLENGPEEPATAEAPDTPEPEFPRPAQVSASPAPQEEPAGVEEAPPREALSGIVGVEKMEIERAEGNLRVHFNLTNIKEGTEPVSGYVHVIARGDRNGSSWHKVYPRGEVRDEFPADYRAGQPFIIQRFKPIQGRFEIRPLEAPPRKIRVVVYDDDGALVYDNSFGLENTS